MTGAAAVSSYPRAGWEFQLPAKPYTALGKDNEYIRLSHTRASNLVLVSGCYTEHCFYLTEGKSEVAKNVP